MKIVSNIKLLNLNKMQYHYNQLLVFLSFDCSMFKYNEFFQHHHNHVSIQTVFKWEYLCVSNFLSDHIHKYYYKHFCYKCNQSHFICIQSHFICIQSHFFEVYVYPMSINFVTNSSDKTLGFTHRPYLVMYGSNLHASAFVLTVALGGDAASAWMFGVDTSLLLVSFVLSMCVRFRRYVPLGVSTM